MPDLNDLARAMEWQSEKDAEARALTLHPADGWPGKNEAERKVAAARTLAEDQAWRGFIDDAATAHAAALRVQANIAGYEDLRRAAEWNIRDRLTAALSDRNIPASANGHTDDYFDPTADEAMYQDAEEAAVPF
jgi:hypothetical protein